MKKEKNDVLMNWMSYVVVDRVEGKERMYVFIFDETVGFDNYIACMPIACLFIVIYRFHDNQMTVER